MIYVSWKEALIAGDFRLRRGRLVSGYKRIEKEEEGEQSSFQKEKPQNKVLPQQGKKMYASYTSPTNRASNVYSTFTINSTM